MSHNKCFLFLPTNGIGLGHLTRSLAIARRMIKEQPSVKIIFLTTSNGIQLVHQEGFLAYHFPPESESTLTKAQWNQMYSINLKLIVKYYKPNVLVFDGAHPYSIINEISSPSLPIKKVWIKKGLNKAEVKRRQTYNKLATWFDYVIIPGEKGVNVPGSTTEIITDPVIYLEKNELLTREDVRKRWRVPVGKKIVYIQLGTETVETGKKLSIITGALEKVGGIFIIIGASIIGKSGWQATENMMIIKEYPNSRYFKAIDLVICAAGYNTFHEVMNFNVPAIFIPNHQVVDDQHFRAKQAEKIGAAIVIDTVTKEHLFEIFVSTLKEKKLTEMKTASENYIVRNGASEIAKFLIDI